MRPTLLAITCLLLTGCTAFRATDSTVAHRHTRLTVNIPPGWYVESLDPVAVLSRNGPPLQRITISATPLGRPLAGTQRTYNDGMLPNEVADLALGLVEATPGHANFARLRLEFDQLAGADAFAAEATFVDASGLPKRLRLHGATLLGHIIQVAYEAADAVYYEMDLAAFENLLESARITTN